MNVENLIQEIKETARHGRDGVTIPEPVFQALLDSLEDAEDLATFNETRGQETFPHELVKALVLGEDHPMKLYRKHRGLTLDQLSEATSIAKGYLSEIENRKKPGSLDAIHKIATALDIDMEDLVEEAA